MKQFINANGTIFAPTNETVAAMMEKDPSLKEYKPAPKKAPAKPKE